MGELRSFRNCTSSRVEKQLKTIKLRMRKIEKERVAVVYLGSRISVVYFINYLGFPPFTTRQTSGISIVKANTILRCY